MPPTPMTLKRIHREISDLQKEDMGAITLAPAGANLFVFHGTIPGPQGSVYEGGIFHVEVHLMQDYPFSAPKVLFKTRIYHMNISEHGNVCLDILKHNWSPALSLFKVMLSLSSLLTDPNPQDPLVPPIAQQYLHHRAQHDNTARDWTSTYAAPPKPKPSKVLKAAKKASTEQPVAGPSRVAGQKRAADDLFGEVLVLDDDDGTSASSSSNTAQPPRKKAKPSNGAGSSSIVILDSDDSPSPARKTRARSRAQQQDPDEVIELDDD